MPPTPTMDAKSQIINLLRRLNDLRTFQLPRLRECKGPLELHRELAEEMRGDLERVRQGIESCKELGESQIRSSDRLSTLQTCDELEHDYSSIRAGYREALVTSKRAIITASRSHRHDLLISRSANGDTQIPSVTTQKAEASRSEMGGDDALQTKTNEVTDALRRTTTLMQAELERSVLSVQMLDESTNTLRLTQTLYDTYENLLSTSAKLVKALERADWYDRLLILSALLLFLAVVVWVLKRRILDRVAGGIGWWVGGSWKLVRMGFGRSGGPGKIMTKSGEQVRKGLTSFATVAGAASVSGAAILSVAEAAITKVVEIEDGSSQEESRRATEVGQRSILDSVVPPAAETSAVLAELNAGIADTARQRDEL